MNYRVYLLENADGTKKHQIEFHLIFEFCEHDLAGLLGNLKLNFSLSEIKDMLQQMINGLFYIHVNKVIYMFTYSKQINNTRIGGD